MLMVQKYGGTSLGDAGLIRRAAERTAELVRQGHRVVTVVSAQGHTTDELAEKAMELNPRAAQRELDACLSAGEQISAALMAMAVEAAGVPAVSLTGWQAGIRTDGVHGSAAIQEIRCRRILEELDRGRAVVVAGFQGISPEGNITTLGRGGSDTSAVALAVRLGAGRCRIFTDVDGVYDKDPRQHPDAVRFRRIGYDAMLALIDGGAQVLHRPCVELAKAHHIPLEVLSAFTGTPGTLVADLESL